jgi:predicted DNA-binding transcriptional regulator AlpA
LSKKKEIQPDEIERNEIQELTGASRSKVFMVSKNISYGFPKRKRFLNRSIVFDREEVLKWISENDLKTMRLSNRPYVKKSAKRKTFNKMALEFLIQKTSKPFKERKVAVHSLFNKYKPIKKISIKLDDIHEQAEIRHINGFSQIHDFNHRMDL